MVRSAELGPGFFRDKAQQFMGRNWVPNKSPNNFSVYMDAVCKTFKNSKVFSLWKKREIVKKWATTSSRGSVRGPESRIEGGLFCAYNRN